tara:strand:+ start:2049 stop:2216 length:168 start_codon:yes stop_codon:yes gene_type:complete
MKLALSISLGSSKPRSGRSTALIVDAFKRRVVSRGGSTTKLGCLTVQLNAIKNIA